MIQCAGLRGWVQAAYWQTIPQQCCILEGFDGRHFGQNIPRSPRHLHTCNIIVISHYFDCKYRIAYNSSTHASIELAT